MTVIRGKDIKIGKNVTIDVDCLELGDRTVINDNAHLEGRRITLGKECWIDQYAHIGGGSCHDGSLVAGDWLHMGRFSHINTARDVRVGDECGIGINTKLFTHGAYTSVMDGFPVEFGKITLGNRVWIPNAIVLPGVTIGDNVVVSAMSLVNRDLPEGCLAGGVPVRVLKEDVYPKPRKDEEMKELFTRIGRDCGVEVDVEFSDDFRGIRVDNSAFMPEQKLIYGDATTESELYRNQLRRNGIRFKAYPEAGRYIRW